MTSELYEDKDQEMPTEPQEIEEVYPQPEAEADAAAAQEVDAAEALPPPLEEASAPEEAPPPVEEKPKRKRATKKPAAEEPAPVEEVSPAPTVPQKPTPPVKRTTASDTHKRLLALDLRELDRNLTEPQQREWNEIYASFRSKSVLSGTVVGVDESAYTLRNRETGELERRRMQSVIVIPYRVKILIPEVEMWLPGSERPAHVLRNMVGSRIDFVIMDVDREGECAIGSRRVAMTAARHYFETAKGGHSPGEQLKCKVMAVGPKRCLVECAGHDLSLTQRDLTYTATADLREKYHPGQELSCILKEYDPRAGQLMISVKESTPNPFDGAETRHPPGSRRQAVITGKYAGGVFCTLTDDTTCLCLYSPQHNDSDFHVGDNVIIVIRQYDHSRQLIYGRILARW